MTLLPFSERAFGTSPSQCLSREPSPLELELQVGDTSTVYVPDLGHCESGDGANLATSLGGLVQAVTWLSQAELPRDPEMLSISTGFVEPNPYPDDCLPAPRECRLDLTTAAMSWSRCSLDAMTGETTSVSETYDLDAPQLESVRNALRLEFGASASCAVLELPESLETINGRIAWLAMGEIELADETGSCFRGTSKPGYAIGVAALADLVDSYAR